MNPTLLLLGSLAIAAIMAILLGVSVFFLQRYMQPEPSVMQDRLARIKTRHEQEELIYSSVSGRDISSLFKQASYSSEELAKLLEQFSFTAHIRKALRQAGMNIPYDRFIFMFMMAPVGVGVLLFLLTALAGAPNMVMLALGFVVAGLSYASLVFRQGARLNRFVTQLPDALSLVTSSLRAGHSFQSALTIVSSELPDPISSEFGQMVNDINLGIPIKEALNKLVNNLDPLPDVRMFATAILVQREVGGNLAEVLDKLSYTIRERFKLKGQISALTGQARLTGYVLGCAPIGILLFLSLFMPKYVEPLYTNTIGHVLLFVGGMLQVVGFLIMRKIVDIRV